MIEPTVLESIDDAHVGAEDVASVLDTIRPYVRETPVVRVERSDLGLPPGPLLLKLEHLQHAGSFKTRGAFAHVLLRDVPTSGVVAASGGNHGAAVAYAAARVQLPATVFVPEVSSPSKIARIREYGARLVVGGASYDDARRAAAAWGAEHGALDVPAFDSLHTILGAGSVALELAAQAPEVDTVLAPVGGGGLLAGICAGYDRRARVIGVEPVGAPTLTAALRHGGPVDAPVGSVAIDSLAPTRIGVHTYSVIERLGGGALLVDDDAITRTQRLVWDRLRLVVEPGGCAGLGALVSGAYAPGPAEVVAVVLSGANTTVVDFTRS